MLLQLFFSREGGGVLSDHVITGLGPVVFLFRQHRAGKVHFDHRRLDFPLTPQLIGAGLLSLEEAAEVLDLGFRFLAFAERLGRRPATAFQAPLRLRQFFVQLRGLCQNSGESSVHLHQSQILLLQVQQFHHVRMHQRIPFI